MTAHAQIQGNSEQAINYGQRGSEPHKGVGASRSSHRGALFFGRSPPQRRVNMIRLLAVLERALSLIGDRKHERFGTTGDRFCGLQGLVSPYALPKWESLAKRVAYGEEAIQIA